MVSRRRCVPFSFIRSRLHPHCQSIVGCGTIKFTSHFHVHVIGKGGLPGVKLSRSVSSQYLTALLMEAPLALGGIEIEIVDKLIYVSYVEMTIKLMERFGVSVGHNDCWDIFLVQGGLQKMRVKVKSDASNTSYFLAGAIVMGFIVTVEGCGTSSSHDS